jgi:hypothetical protein
MFRKPKTRGKQPWIAAVIVFLFGGVGCFYVDWLYGLIGSVVWIIAFAWAEETEFWLPFLVQIVLGIIAFKICVKRNLKLQREPSDDELLQKNPQLSGAIASPAASASPRPLRKAVKFACILVVVDAFFLNQGIFSALIAAAAVACVPWAVWALVRKNNAQFRIRSAQIGIVLAGCLAVFGINWFQNKRADEKAIELGNACLAYHVKYNRYPKRLEELTPEFVAEIPPAKHTLLTRYFSYCFSGTGEPEIYYVELPPFGRRFYHVETGNWGYLD